MTKRFTSEGSTICLFGMELVPRPTAADAAKRATAANEKYATVEHSALCVQFGVPFTTLQKWLQNNS